MADAKTGATPAGYGDRWLGPIPRVVGTRDGKTALVIVDMPYQCMAAARGLDGALDNLDRGAAG